MKILMTLFDIQDYGGIINHAENLAAGFKELGHSVDFVKLCAKHKFGTPRTITDESLPQYRRLGTGLFFHQAKGWWWPNDNKVAYLDETARERFVDNCANYDAVLWHIPVPTTNKDNAGVNEWLALYSGATKNIAIIHDGNMPELYPHLAYVSHYFHGMVCVHESAYHSGSCIGLPRKLIVNPFDISPQPNTGINEFGNRDGFTAVQVFKAWKRVDDLIRAIPKMSNKEAKRIGGAGIEYRYMTSQDKCKPKYFDEQGDRIWDKALRYGMVYAGTIPTDVHYSMLRQSKLQIDPSWSKKYSKFGAHFNRTTVEAILCGAVPVATDLGMKNSEVFKAGQNYIQLQAGGSPQDFADVIDEAVSNKTQWEQIATNNNVLLERFDRKAVAQEYVDFIKDSSSCEVGQENQELIERMLKKLEFFGIWQARAGIMA